MEWDQAAFYERLKRLAGVREESQRQICLAAGVTPQAWTEWRQGPPGVITAVALANALHVHPAFLLFGVSVSRQQSDSEYGLPPRGSKLRRVVKVMDRSMTPDISGKLSKRKSGPVRPRVSRQESKPKPRGSASQVSLRAKGGEGLGGRK